jgi:hypothetical protein
MPTGTYFTNKIIFAIRFTVRPPNVFFTIKDSARFKASRAGLLLKYHLIVIFDFALYEKLTKKEELMGFWTKRTLLGVNRRCPLKVGNFDHLITFKIVLKLFPNIFLPIFLHENSHVLWYIWNHRQNYHIFKKNFGWLILPLIGLT